MSPPVAAVYDRRAFAPVCDRPALFSGRAVGGHRPSLQLLDSYVAISPAGRFRSRGWPAELPDHKSFPHAAGKGFRSGIDRAISERAERAASDCFLAVKFCL